VSSSGWIWEGGVRYAGREWLSKSNCWWEDVEEKEGAVEAGRCLVKVMNQEQLGLEQHARSRWTHDMTRAWVVPIAWPRAGGLCAR
jgi:hypothetical protein